MTIIRQISNQVEDTISMPEINYTMKSSIPNENPSSWLTRTNTPTLPFHNEFMKQFGNITITFRTVFAKVKGLPVDSR